MNDTQFAEFILQQSEKYDTQYVPKPADSFVKSDDFIVNIIDPDEVDGLDPTAKKQIRIPDKGSKSYSDMLENNCESVKKEVRKSIINNMYTEQFIHDEATVIKGCIAFEYENGLLVRLDPNTTVTVS